MKMPQVGKVGELCKVVWEGPHPDQMSAQSTPESGSVGVHVHTHTHARTRTHPEHGPSGVSAMDSTLACPLAEKEWPLTSSVTQGHLRAASPFKTSCSPSDMT